MAQEDRDKLIKFLDELEKRLNDAVHWPKSKTSGKFRVRFEGAWDTVRKAFERLRAELSHRAEEVSHDASYGTPDPTIDEKLASRGLVGEQLDLKLAGWHRVQSWKIFAWLFPRRWLAALLRWANVILGSLSSVFPPAEIIKEYKECIENDLTDQRIRSPWLP